MIEIFSAAFMQRALLAALITGLLAPAIGTYIVQRRLSLLGDGLGHVAIAGVGLALITSTAPLPMAVAVAVLGGIVVETLRQRGSASGDVGLAILFYGGLATGVLLSAAAGSGTGALSQFLFGSLTTVAVEDLVLIGVLSAIVLIPAIGLSPQLFAICTDEDFARVLGIRVRLYNYLIVVLASLTVTLAMRTVGLLLVSALMVVPVAASLNLVSGLRRGLFTAMAVGAVAAVGGTIGSYYADLPPGALIVLVTIGIFALSAPIGAWAGRRGRMPDLADDRTAVAVGAGSHLPIGDHPHEHSETCGHPTVRHGDHVDHVHDGHLHSRHHDHYDEH